MKKINSWLKLSRKPWKILNGTKLSLTSLLNQIDNFSGTASSAAKDGSIISTMRFAMTDGVRRKMRPSSRVCWNMEKNGVTLWNASRIKGQSTWSKIGFSHLLFGAKRTIPMSVMSKKLSEKLQRKWALKAQKPFLSYKTLEFKKDWDRSNGKIK